MCFPFRRYKKSPPLLLVSFDGFQGGYLERKEISAFKRIQKCGVHAASMRPTHPSITFPNHYSIATGLFSESHGIVDNQFFESELNRQFDYRTPDSKESVWWNGQPIWVTAKKQGKRAYSLFFVGAEVCKLLFSEFSHLTQGFQIRIADEVKTLPTSLISRFI